MPVPTRKTAPNWLCAAHPDASPGYERSVRYYRKLYRAWPSWCENHIGFRQINAEQRRRLQVWGDNVVIDHIVPICSAYVCGLHVPWNLKIITPLANGQKSNNWWPDSWYENLDMFGPYTPQQLELIK